MSNWSEKLLHIYGQASYHESTYIVGNREALEALSVAISQALASFEEQNKIAVSTADGEGYTTHIVVLDTPRMDKITLPYSSWQTQPINKRPPYSLVKEVSDDEILSDDDYFEWCKKIERKQG